MKLIKASFQIETLLNRKEILHHLERQGRICYKSEDKITEKSASKFVKNIISRGHLSVIEHFSITVKIICDRGVSHELVRHRLASYSQESIRYCNYNKKGMTFIIPCWMSSEHILLDIVDYSKVMKRYPNESITSTEPYYLWYVHMLTCEKVYNDLLYQGWMPEQARSILPNSLKTEIVITANLREWMYIFEQRCSSRAHPQMREIMIPLQKEFKRVLPEIFWEEYK